jgi:hypothetical protein
MSTPWSAALDRALHEAARAFSAASPGVAHGLLAPTTPLTIWLCGRQGVGKTRLLNHLAEVDLPTGLGGLTREPAVLERDGRRWVDTPGIEAADPLHLDLPDPDLIVWVVDSLQPLSQRAREVALRLGERASLRPVLGRADLVPLDERAAIEARVRHLLPEPPSEPPRWLDARHRPDAPTVAWLVAPPRSTAPHRRDELRRRLHHARDLLGPPPPDLRAAPAACRAHWRAAVAALSDPLPDAPLPRRAEQALHQLHDRLLHDPLTAPLLRAWGPPSLPAMAALPDPDPLLTALSGEAGSRRLHRATLADWLLAGELALTDWLGTGLPDDRAHQLLHTAHAALDHAEAQP